MVGTIAECSVFARVLCVVLKCTGCVTLVCCCTVADHAYTHLKGPIPWMAPETFDEGEKGHVVSAASDVYMLGSCFVEVATGCERQPFDWLTPQRCFLFRGNDDTGSVNCIEVRRNGLKPAER